MVVPIEFWNSLSWLIRTTIVMIILYFGSGVYRNIKEAYHKPIYNKIEYKYCEVYPQEWEED